MPDPHIAARAGRRLDDDEIEAQREAAGRRSRPARTPSFAERLGGATQPSRFRASTVSSGRPNARLGAGPDLDDHERGPAEPGRWRRCRAPPAPRGLACRGCCQPAAISRSPTSCSASSPVSLRLGPHVGEDAVARCTVTYLRIGRGHQPDPRQRLARRDDLALLVAAEVELESTHRDPPGGPRRPARPRRHDRHGCGDDRKRMVRRVVVQAEAHLVAGERPLEGEEAAPVERREARAAGWPGDAQAWRSPGCAPSRSPGSERPAGPSSGRGRPSRRPTHRRSSTSWRRRPRSPCRARRAARTPRSGCRPRARDRGPRAAQSRVAWRGGWRGRC